MEIPDEVLVALRGLLAALERVRPAHVNRMLAAAREVQASLEARLKAVAPGRYTTQEVRGKLAQVRAVVEVLGVEYGRRIGSEVEAVGRVASQIGRDGLVEQIRAWGPKFPEAARLLSRPREASDVLDPGLLEYYRVSRETYGIEAINKMKGSLAKAALEGKTIVQAWEDMAPAVDLPEWKAERIVRTEQSFASHRRQILDAIDAYGDDVEEIFAKQLVATFDNRTGEDSVRVHEQVRRLMEPFNDGKRDYQHPPNRPNDREVVVLVPLDEVEGELGGVQAKASSEEQVGESEKPGVNNTPLMSSGATGSESEFGPDLGKYSKRRFNLSQSGGPLEERDWRKTKITTDAVRLAQEHTSRFVGRDPRVDEMFARAKAIASGRLKATDWDKRFIAHELRERERYIALGWPQGEPDDPDEAWRMWNNAHTATLEEYKLTDIDLLHPVVRSLLP